MKKAPSKCLFCGVLLNNINNSKDHVPARMFFSKPYPVNMITVPCCKSCNDEGAKDDEYFREKLVINIENTHEHRNAMSEPIIRSLGRPVAAGNLERFKKELKPSPILNMQGNPFLRLTHDENRIDKSLIRCVKSVLYNYFIQTKSDLPVDHEFFGGCGTIPRVRFTKIEDLEEENANFIIGNIFRAWIFGSIEDECIDIVLRFMNFDFVYTIKEL